MIRGVPLLLLALVACWSAPALAARLEGLRPGPTIGTTIDGFNQVMGPSANEPEHSGAFIKPRPMPCPSCPPAVPPPVNPPAGEPPHQAGR